MEKHFELKHGEKVLATLVKSVDGHLTLIHDLTFDQLQMLPMVIPFDETGKFLTIRVGNIRPGVNIALYDVTGGSKSGSLRMKADFSMCKIRKD
jgi:hypothetical protein